MTQSMPLENVVDETKRLISRAAKEVQAGNKEQARALLRLAVDRDPDGENAWLWRMSLARTKGELVEFGARVLHINPDNQQAQEWLRKVVGDEGHRRVVASLPAEAAGASVSGSGPRGGGPRSEIGAKTTGAAPPGVSRAPASVRSEEESHRPTSPSLNGGAERDEIGRLGRPFPGDLLPPKSPGPSTDSSVASLYRLRGALHRQNNLAAAPARPEPAKPVGLPSTPSTNSSLGSKSSPTQAGWTCPLCDGRAERKRGRCGRCGGLLDLDALNGVRTNLEVDRELLKAGVLRLQRLLDEAPDEEVHLRLAVIHLNLCQADQARKHLQAALDLQPEDQQIGAQLRAIRDRKVVLVVDSDEEVRARIGEIVEPYRIRVTHASSGLQALSQVEQDMPDLILLNMTLPRMDGYEVCKILKKNAAAKNLPIVMLTEQRGLVEKLRGRAAGVAGSVQKPVEPVLLLRALKKSLPDSYLPDPELTAGATFKM